jgi:hypothetical protein
VESKSRRTLVAMLVLSSVTVVCFGTPQPTPSGTDLKTFIGSLPDISVPAFTDQQALAILAMPLSCIDRLEDHPPELNYLYTWETKPRLLEDFQKRRAFYGCYDWHSAVNSTWAMAAILRRFPQLQVGSLIREKLNDHLTKTTIEGEVTFFITAKDFEQPYGRAWLLKLYADLLDWDDPDAHKWATNLAPLAERFSSGLAQFLKELPFVTRAGVHQNTAYSMSLMMDYADVAKDGALREAVVDSARQVFLHDADCPTAYEPSGPDFLSPCLEEAKIMSRVLPKKEFLTWFGEFMPMPNSAKFKPLLKSFDTTGITREEQMASKSHLIGLAFNRAEAMLRIAAALPADDERGAAYRKIADLNAQEGFKNLSGAGYLGTHWLGTAALRYELARQASAK